MKNAFKNDSLTSVTDDFEDKLEEEEVNLRCLECEVDFTSKYYLYQHLYHHIKQPVIILNKLPKKPHLPPLKITIKNTAGNSFEIINSPNNLGGTKDNIENNKLEDSKEVDTDSKVEQTSALLQNNDGAINDFDAVTLEDINGIIESETGSGSGSEHNEMVTGPIITEITEDESGEKSTPDNYDTIPGAEPTPPPDPSPESYPKIRIKTTGLLKDPTESRCTITELTDEHQNGQQSMNDSSNSNHLWSNPTLDEQLKLPESEDNILSLFNNNERAKDFGFTTSDSEYISLDRLDSRNNGGALQLYNRQSNQNSLDNLTGLPMQALAQQVSRLQPSGNGMHQQNVLINIQQFPQPPTQNPYQPPPSMYHHSGQPMYPPYQYQPPNPMYYPPGPTYPPPPQHMQQPPQMPPPPPMGQPQMNQTNQMLQPPMSQGQIMPPSSSSSSINSNQTNMGQHPQFRQRLPGPRQQMPGQRMNGPRPPMNPRMQMATRQRVPLNRPRGVGPMQPMRGMRPRLPTTQNQQQQQQYRQSPVKRTVDTIKQEHNQVKKKRFDLLTPDKDDDDCQVICMQPKNTDGLPQIQSVQGGTMEQAENSIMHLSDSITLSVRNPPPKPVSPKKSDAKAVANILATRGITVTPTAKPKEKQEEKSSSIATSLNLNGAVSIIPSAKQQQQQVKKQEADLPTVDLTDDISPQNKQNLQNQKGSNMGLPYRCSLCPAQYPTAVGLNKHRINYHKTSDRVMDMGIPVVNLKQPGILQKLGQLGFHNFIPLPTCQPDGTFAIPIINTKNPSGNINALGTSNVLILGPIKTIPRPGQQQQQQQNVNKPTGYQQNKN